MTEPVSNPPELLLTFHELTTVLKLSERTIATLVKNGEIPSVKIGRSRRFPAKAIEEWIAAKISTQTQDSKSEKSSEDVA